MKLTYTKKKKVFNFFSFADACYFDFKLKK